LVGWNGLVIAALADAGALAHAERAAKFILDAQDELPHQIAGGKPSGKAYLEDYAAFAEGCLAIARYKEYAEHNRAELEAAGHKLGGESSAFWRSHGERLTAEMIERFYDEGSGAFCSTSSEHEELFGRSKPAFDSPTPSGNALAIRCLVAIGDDERALRTANALLGWMEKAPQATEGLYAAIMPLIPGGVVTQVGNPAIAPTPGEVTARLEPKEITTDSAGTGRGEVVLVVPEGIHLNGNEPRAKWLTPTALTFQPVQATVDYPPGDTYEGEVRIPFTIQLAPAQSGEEFEATVAYQACTESECLMPASITLYGVVSR
jgi:hypothetical protein